MFDESKFLFSEGSSSVISVSDRVTTCVPVVYPIPTSLSDMAFPLVALVTVQPKSPSVPTCLSNSVGRQVDTGVVLASPSVLSCLSYSVGRQVDTSVVLASPSVDT